MPQVPCVPVFHVAQDSHKLVRHCEWSKTLRSVLLSLKYVSLAFRYYVFH